MKKYFELVIFLCSSFVGIAQNNVPPVFEITTDTAEYLNLNNSNWQMLEDKPDKLTIDQVRQTPVANQFHTNTGIAKGVNVYWFRYRVKNTLKQQKTIAIPMDGALYADEYTKNSTGRWDHKMTGYLVPWSKRDGLKKIVQILDTLRPGEELLLYDRVKLDDIILPPPDFHISLQIGLADKVIRENYIDNEPSARPFLILGIFLVAAFLNLYFFIVVRERVYLYFSLFITFESLARFLQDTDILFREHPSTRVMIHFACFWFYDLSFIQFVRYFLATFKHMPRWDKFLIGLSIYTCVLAILRQLHLISLEDVYFEAIGGESILFFATLSFLFFLNPPDRQARLRIRTVLPGVFIILIYTFPTYIALFSRLTGITVPDFLYLTYYHKYEEVAVAWLIIVFSVSLFRRFQQLQKKIAFEAVEKERMAKEKEIERSQLIAQQKVELEKTVEERTAELKHSLTELKSTQAQLIQSEKMASLGELTAGIAHEIQNPLNFVNNFSDVNKELLEELKDEADKGNIDEVKVIANDVISNEEKINYHGKRADSIVKGMLEHSRTSTGQKELTDINKLADEYLRLSYHGLRAKDKSFNTEIKTDFDTSLEKINIVPQDIGRVLLNLFNNAFYATNERCKAEGERYKAIVCVQTKKINNKIEIRVSDNGSGISQSIVDKIFQPFFTTKPTGQGTGLGLSLAYDIIRAHGGEIKVESKEGEGTGLIIQLPMS